VLGDMISKEMIILSDTTYQIDNQSRPSWVASDSTSQNVKIIDKETGLVFSYENHETEVLSVGNYITITDTNFFDTKISDELFEAEIPEWWKYTTRWLMEEKISESEYIDGLEALISQNLLKV
jgi:NAD-dependent DNA ligase